MAEHFLAYVDGSYFLSIPSIKADFVDLVCETWLRTESWSPVFLEDEHLYEIFGIMSGAGGEDVASLVGILIISLLTVVSRRYYSKPDFNV
jgi:hypothetical protein